MAGHVRDSIKQINKTSWLIGAKLILRRQPTDSAPEYLWKDSGDGSCYTLSGASDPLPQAEPLPTDSHIRLIREAGDASAVWSLGDAFLKVKLISEDAATKEHVTLNWLAERRLSFAIPKVLYYSQSTDRGYLFISRVPGQTLAQVWRHLDEGDKQHYVRSITGICKELSEFQSNAMIGIDGAHFHEPWLDVGRSPHSFKPETLQENCRKLGMRCSGFVFCHSDLGPGNIIVENGSVGIIDWEMAGYAPLEWIRTKFGVSWGMDFSWPEVDADDESLTEWRKRVEKQLGDEGYPEVMAAWKAWFVERFTSTR